MNKFMRATLAEFVGTFILVFVGSAAVVNANGNVLIPAFAHGLAVVGLAYTYGHVSGTQINPAVTLGFLVGGKMSLQEAIADWIAQFAGGILAAFVLFALIPTTGGYGETTGSLTEGSVWMAAAMEAILTFVLVGTIYQTAIYKKADNFAGIAIGLTLTMLILAGGPFTGASLNPARTLGPAIVAGNLSYVLPYFVGIFGGGALAGLFHTYVLPSND